ncbi:hypothetical protein HQ544_03290 [Candidatus Falkowbacteria bacterium]|nr:hypothetical protein [Candidatus Falkowbacteria bacterium]
MKIQFPYRIRQAMQVAMAVAESKRGGRRVSLLSLKEVAEEGPGFFVKFWFEGSLRVDVHLVDINPEPHPETYVVTQVLSGEEVWGPDRLLELQHSGGWYHPNVMDIDVAATYVE